MRHLSRVIGAGATVMIGNSLPIREWNLAADVPKPGTRFFANRGANGIDGLVSTWLGVSADANESWLVLGDLSALYDLSAPWILPQLPGAKRRIVVINNGGGKIFSRVSWLKGVDAQTKRAMVNPHDISFEPWAKLWNMEYRLVTDWQTLQDDETPNAIWEVRPDEAETEAFWQAWQK
jgi:2-succinyl-5-enolpyruvyl-6-hydroxy-3-cyclohexene-1-carboxylate synthase